MTGLEGGAGTDTVELRHRGRRCARQPHHQCGEWGDGSDVLSLVENVNGSAYADYLTGSAGVNVLRAGSGNDIVKGMAGNDSIYG